MYARTMSSSSNEATMILMAHRGHGEPLAQRHVFQLPFLLAWLGVLGVTRAAERRVRMVRAHGSANEVRFCALSATPPFARVLGAGALRSTSAARSSAFASFT